MTMASDWTLAPNYRDPAAEGREEMSTFACEHCGTICRDSRVGYVTGCAHYPADVEIQHCRDCGAEIVADDDDALICIECGGRNRRIRYD